MVNVLAHSISKSEMLCYFLSKSLLKKNFKNNKWAEYFCTHFYTFLSFSWRTFGIIITQPFRVSDQMCENIFHTFISLPYVSLKGKNWYHSNTDKFKVTRVLIRLTPFIVSIASKGPRKANNTFFFVLMLFWFGSCSRFF